jgi:hypothetical protein
MNDNLKNWTVATSLSCQKISAIIRALDGLGEKRSGMPSLLKRLQFAIKEGLTNLEFSGEEIHDIIDALRKAYRETLNVPGGRYGFLSVAELQAFIEYLEQVSGRC